MKNAAQLGRMGSSLVAFAVAVVIAIAVNVILGSVNLRVDLTEEKLYTLSDGTRAILKSLDRPVTLKFFFSEGNPEIPVHIKHYGRRVLDLLVEYQHLADGSLILEKYDPEPDSDAEDWAQRYGIQGQGIGYMGPVLYLGLVATTAEAQATLPVLDPRNENLLEYEITRMITRVTNPEKPVVGIISGLPVLGVERPPFAMPGQPQPDAQPAWFAFQDLREDYELRRLSTPLKTVSEDVTALLLVHPKELDDETLFAIDQFVLRGGRLLCFVDPLCLVEAQQQPAPQMMQFSSPSSDLPRLFDAWGVTFSSGQVLADLEASSRLRTGGGGQVEESPVWLSLTRNHLKGDDVLTANLDSLMLPYAGAFQAESREGLTVTPLVRSSETSSLVDAMTAQFSVDGVRRQFRSSMTRHALALRLHGKLPTAFPEGRPVSGNGDDDAPDGTDGTDEPFLTESAGESTVILVGDVDLLYDAFAVREVNFFGFTAHQPMNDNLAFFANMMEQLAGSTALVSVRTRGRSQRPFDVVLDLQRRAQEKYMAEEMRLQQRLEEAQSRLNELQTRKDQHQQFILSPEQKAAIDNFRAQVAQTREELKLVRRRLREDIERLGVRIKAINILLMPALVSIAGVGFGAWRRSRTRRGISS